MTLSFMSKDENIFFLLIIEENMVTVDIWPEYDEDRKRRCEVDYIDIKEIKDYTFGANIIG